MLVELHDAFGHRVTADIWTSIAQDSILTSTVHCFDKLWNLRNANLASSVLPAEHTAILLKEHFHKCLKDLETDKIIHVVTDGGSNFVSSVEKAGFDRIICAARNIHLSVIESVNNNPIVLCLTEKV